MFFQDGKTDNIPASQGDNTTHQHTTKLQYPSHNSILKTGDGQRTKIQSASNKHDSSQPDESRSKFQQSLDELRQYIPSLDLGGDQTAPDDGDKSQYPGDPETSYDDVAMLDESTGERYGTSHLPNDLELTHYGDGDQYIFRDPRLGEQLKEQAISDSYQSHDYHNADEEQAKSLNNPYESLRLVNDQYKLLKSPRSDYEAKVPDKYQYVDLPSDDLLSSADQYHMKSEYDLNSDYPTKPKNILNSGHYLNDPDDSLNAPRPIQPQYLERDEYTLNGIDDAGAWIDRRLRGGYEGMSALSGVYPDLSKRWHRSTDTRSRER